MFMGLGHGRVILEATIQLNTLWELLTFRVRTCLSSSVWALTELNPTHGLKQSTPVDLPKFEREIITDYSVPLRHCGSLLRSKS